MKGLGYVGRCMAAYWRYMQSPKGAFEWRSYVIFIGITILCIILGVCMVWIRG